MARKSVLRYDHSAEYWTHRGLIAWPDQSGREAPLNPALALLLIILLSIGLWWGILWAVPAILSHLL